MATTTLPISLTSPLPAADLRFDSMSYTSGLSVLDELHLNLLSEKADLEPDKLLGQQIDLEVELRDGELRHICGYVARFGMGRHQGRYYGYRAEVVPWLWFLTRSADCRIFQQMSVPEIVEKVFGDHAAIASFEFKLAGSYRKREYCVQYRETDFNFVSRLMEEEGIYWFFEHTAGEHKLIIVDATSAHAAVPGYEKLPFYGNTGQLSPDVDFVSNWNFSRGVRTGKVVLRSYNFETPSTSLEVQQSVGRAHDQATHEQFDWQGDYLKKPDGQHLADMRIDELQTRHEQRSGLSNAYGLASGHLFTLTRHPRADQNAEYLCVQAQVQAQINGLEAGNAAGPNGGQNGGEWQCSFAAIPSSQQFRPPRRTPKPFVQGPQTAVVVGPAGEEIFTDKYGRVKVQFHWDREGRKNESSSCWMRVSSPWAGKSFGFVQIPRIGQEVIVDFLEGDPDQPIITGRVYNAEQMPPWELPANATQSGVLSRSSKGGAYGNANALRFEDKKGAEQVWLHAEKNQDIEVENDETHWVGHDRTKTIDHDETEHVKHDRTKTIDNDEKVHVKHDRTETVDNNEKITIGVNRTESVGNNESISIGNNRTESVGASETVSVGKNRTHDIGENESLTVGKDRNHSVGKNETISIGTDQTETIGKNLKLQVGENRQSNVAKDDKLQVGKKFFLEAGDEITLKTGDASITMKKDGTITIKGKDITVQGSGKIAIKASSDVVIKGSKIAEN